MKRLMILLLLLLLADFGKADFPAPMLRSSKWVISQNSSLVVKGNTNVNRFSCAIDQYPKTDTVMVTADQNNNMLLSGVLNIEVKHFDCQNLMMTRQLRKTLKEDQFPAFQVRFLSLKETPLLKQKKDFVKGFVALTITGVTKQFEICYQLSRDKNTMVLVGNQTINFSDFKLDPPKRMGKLILAKDQLSVAFVLKMESVI